MAAVDDDLLGIEGLFRSLDRVISAVESQAGVLGFNAVLIASGHVEGTFTFEDRVDLAVDSRMELAGRAVCISVSHAADRTLGKCDLEGITADDRNACAVIAVNIYAVQDQFDVAFTGIDIDTSGEFSGQNIGAGFCDVELSVFLTKVNGFRIGYCGSSGCYLCGGVCSCGKCCCRHACHDECQ